MGSDPFSAASSSSASNAGPRLQQSRHADDIDSRRHQAQETVDVVTPAAGESVTEGTILEWHVKVGDFIKADDTIVEISTDKVDLELPAPATGTVGEILIEEGATVTVGQVIARITVNGAAPSDTSEDNGGVQRGADGTDGAAANAQAGEAPVAEKPDAQAPGAEAPAGEATSLPRAPVAADIATADVDGAKISPVAARAAAAEGVDLASVSGQRARRAG